MLPSRFFTGMGALDHKELLGAIMPELITVSSSALKLGSIVRGRVNEEVQIGVGSVIVMEC